MILRPKSLPRHTGPLPGATIATPVVLVPAWLRRAVPDAQSLAAKDVEDVALAAGAALGALDAVVRREEKWAGAWRQRLALAAAAVTAKQAGRVEDEHALRDAVLLTRPGDFLSVGPAGLLLLAWRRLAARPAEELLTEKNLAAVLEEFGYAPDDEVLSDLADELGQLGAGMVEMLTGAFMVAERQGFGRAVGAWLADALLAQRLGWTHAVPLLGTETALGRGLSRPRGVAGNIAPVNVETGSDRTKSLLAAQAHAVLRAIDLCTALERRAERLLAVVPKLRAKGSHAIVDRLLNEDALVASRAEQKTGMSDRGLRRLFDRLVELGAVRELSGRLTFRIYGL
ncbi:DUF1403 family protein [Mesorhizobium sp.]|uniref:DUF1403 family protein n=1 Tax=Mesorhizobium sp. TaxID=1871066 RepID=UPI000FE8ADD7|nr:DUF1403 family protein [Mesorhizobium sp.]RWN25226.1 MAG: DUF1403 family protein [Mesorhizobium sp.]